MKIFIPINELAPQYLNLTLPSITNQIGVQPEDIIQVFTPLPTDKTARWKVLAKTACKERMLKVKDNYLVINDFEFKNLYNQNYSDMKSFLDRNPDYGAVSLFRKRAIPIFKYDPRIPSHICNGIIMFRKAALKDVDFGLFPTQPSCLSVGKSLHNAGWNYGYMAMTIRCEKLIG